MKVKDLKRVDLVLVTHGAFDHLGDAVEIAKKFPAALMICGNEIKDHAVQQGVSPARIKPMAWGMSVIEGGIKIRSVYCRHTSYMVEPDGTVRIGFPMGFIVYPDPNVRVYVNGDTALFGDLSLIGRLYRPNIGLLNVALPVRPELKKRGLPQWVDAEMSPYEAALAAHWLGLEYAIAIHFDKTDQDEVKQFVRMLKDMKTDSAPPVTPIVLEPGESFTYEGHNR